MSEKTLNETIGEVIGETMTPQKTSTIETEQGISRTASDETQSGDTSEKEYVSGIDISDVPVHERPRIKEYLSKKAKLLEDGSNKKFQEIAGYKKERDDLIKLGLSIEEARDVLQKHIELKKNPTTSTSEKSKAMRTLDKLIETSSYEQRPALEQMRQIILEETSAPEIREKVDRLEKALQGISYERSLDRETQIKGNFDTLRSKYGDIIDKYSETLLAEGIRYPKADVRQILHSIVPPDELEEALLNNKTKKTQTKDKLNAISSSGAGVTSSKEQVNTKQSWKGLLSELGRK